MNKEEYKKVSESNIYIREIEEDKYLVYQPLCGYAITVDKHLLSCLPHFCTIAVSGELQKDNVPAELKGLFENFDKVTRRVYRTERSVDGLRNMMLLPNNRCNFTCSYCYSAFGRNGKEIDAKTLITALDYFLDSERAKDERLTISVLGGGEPLLSWKTLRLALDHAYELARRRGMPLPVSLVTNGSILSDEIIEYIKEHDISVSVSFDILPDIQDSQRGHYEVVAANIRSMCAAGLDIAFNSVITEQNVDRMDDMLVKMKNDFPGVKKVSFKSLITGSMFASPEKRKAYYRKFVDNFFNALNLAESMNIWLTSPYYNNALCVSDRFCPGKFVVTSEGDISICHCVGSSGDKLYDKFIFGKIRNGKVKIDDGKLTEILSHDNTRNERCQICIARWHCAGGCYADNSTVGETDTESQEAYCESMRYFMQRFIERKFLSHDKQ